MTAGRWVSFALMSALVVALVLVIGDPGRGVPLKLFRATPVTICRIARRVPAPSDQPVDSRN